MAFLAYPAVHPVFVLHACKAIDPSLSKILHKTEHGWSDVLDGLLSSRKRSCASAYTRRHKHECMHDVCSPLRTSKCVCISLLGYFAFFLGAARIPDIPVSGWEFVDGKEAPNVHLMSWVCTVQQSFSFSVLVFNSSDSYQNQLCVPPPRLQRLCSDLTPGCHTTRCS